MKTGFERRKIMLKATIYMSNGNIFVFDEATTASLLDLLRKEQDFAKLKPIKITDPQGKLRHILNPTQIAYISFE
jgi:hypothetical protein